MAKRSSIKLTVAAASVCGSLVGYDLFERLWGSEFNNEVQQNSPKSGFQSLFGSPAGCQKLEQVHNENGLKLRQVNIVFRHGARTPISPNRHVPEESWDADIFMKDIKEKHLKYNLLTADGKDAGGSSLEHYFPRKTLKGGSVAGSLTSVGQQQMYNLGRTLKDHYIRQQGFISQKFDKNDVYVRTTNVDRTIQSVVCLLSGMYDPEDTAGDLPIITGPLDKESMYPNYYNCKKLYEWVKHAFTSVDFLPSMQKLTLEVISIASLEDCSTPMEIILVRDEVAARVAHKIAVPQILLDKYDVLEKAAVSVQLGIVTGDNDLRLIRLSIGHFLEEVCLKMEEAMSNKSSHKLCLYSSHDTALMSLLIALGVFDGRWPEFSANVRIEILSNEEEKWFIRILYDNKELTLPGCSSAYCPWERFQELVAPIRVKDWDEECENNKTAPVEGT